MLSSNTNDQNTLSIGEIKRSGMTAIEASLRRGPAHIVKRNRLAAVILSPADYLQLTRPHLSDVPGMTAAQWLMAQPSLGKRSKAAIDAALAQDRAW